MPRQAHRDDSHPTQEKWWEKLGFKLPDDTTLSRSSQIREGTVRRGGYAQLASSPTAQVRALPEDAPYLRGRGHLRRDPSLDALRPSFASRPSSIDGRRPASVITPSNRPPTSQNALDDRDELPPSESPSSDTDAPPLLPLTLRETLRLSLQFTFVWFLANYTLNAGLGLTSVASGTTLSSASGFFTLALGSVFAVETFTWTKLVAVGVSFAGVSMVTWADAGMRAGAGAGSLDGLVEGVVMLAKRAVTEGPPPLNAVAGDLLALASAFCERPHDSIWSLRSLTLSIRALVYAVYVTLLKVRIQSEDRVSMPLFFGFVGFFNIALLWPFGLLLHFIGIEPFSWPQDRMTWLGVAVNMAITLISDFAYLLAMLKSSPLIATVGLSLTIPLAVMGDIAKGSHSGGAQAIIGSAMVLVSTLDRQRRRTRPDKSLFTAELRRHWPRGQCTDR